MSKRPRTLADITTDSAVLESERGLAHNIGCGIVLGVTEPTPILKLDPALLDYQRSDGRLSGCTNLLGQGADPDDLAFLLTHAGRKVELVKSPGPHFRVRDLETGKWCIIEAGSGNVFLVDDASLEFSRVDGQLLVEQEQARWQERIARTILAAGLEPIDASGNESGDPLDWTDEELRHDAERWRADHSDGTPMGPGISCNGCQCPGCKACGFGEYPPCNASPVREHRPLEWVGVRCDACWAASTITVGGTRA